MDKDSIDRRVLIAFSNDLQRLLFDEYECFIHKTYNLEQKTYSYNLIGSSIQYETTNDNFLNKYIDQYSCTTEIFQGLNSSIIRLTVN